VALDGSPLAEAVLLPAAQFVAACSSAGAPGELRLLRVIKPPSDQEEHKYLTYDLDISAYQRSEAERYLRTIQGKLAQEAIDHLNVQITFSIIEDADIATALIRAAETGDRAEHDTDNGYTMIALATHGRGGITHWMLGSIAERTLEKTRLPLLIVRPQQATTSTRS